MAVYVHQTHFAQPSTPAPYAQFWPPLHQNVFGGRPLPGPAGARDLGVVIDSRLSLSDHVASVCRSGYNQLRQLQPVVRCSSEDATKTLVQAFIASRLDYCNALYYGIYDKLIRRLQSVQHAAARLVTGTMRSDHISLVLRQLHWLPVRQRVVFKVATLVYHRCAATLRATSSTTVGWSPMYAPENCVLLTLERSLSTGPAAVSVTGRSLLLRLEYGTVCRLT